MCRPSKAVHGNGPGGLSIPPPPWWGTLSSWSYRAAPQTAAWLAPCGGRFLRHPSPALSSPSPALRVASDHSRHPRFRCRPSSECASVGMKRLASPATWWPFAPQGNHAVSAASAPGGQPWTVSEERIAPMALGKPIFDGHPAVGKRNVQSAPGPGCQSRWPPLPRRLTQACWIRFASSCGFHSFFTMLATPRRRAPPEAVPSCPPRW
jgi:hypothetical protein